MGNTAIELQNVTKSFKISRQRGIFGIFQKKSKLENNILKALDNISFDVKKGECLGIIGKNGSGKSTLLRVIAQVYEPDSGIVKVNGRLSPMMQIGTGFQNAMPAKENIIMNGMLLGLTKGEIETKVEKIIEYAELGRFKELPIKHYSTGMRARLAFSTAIQINPDKIGELIGPGGKIINKIIDETGAEIDIQDSGLVFVTSEKKEAAEKAVDWIKNITREVKAGEVFQGKVKTILDFGAFVEILPGQDGLIHISKLSDKRVEKVEDVVKIGDIVSVKVISVDDRGRINLILLR